MKRYLAVLAAGMFFVVCVSLYLMLETSDISRAGSVDIMEQVSPQGAGVVGLTQSYFAKSPILIRCVAL